MQHISSLQQMGNDGRLVSGFKSHQPIAPQQQLAGRIFLVTRTNEGNAEERRLLEKYGAMVVEYPTIEISHPTSLRKMDQAILRFEEFDWAIFTSTNGVRLFFQRLAKKREGFYKTLRQKKTPKFGCVGPSTRLALEQLGFRCSAMPKAYLTEELGKLFRKKAIEGRKVLLARAEVANKNISRILRKSGAIVTEVPVYRTISKALKKPLPREVTDVSLTSPSTVDGVSRVLKKQKLESSRIRFHCIGPVTAARARESGLVVYTTARVHTIDGLINDIVQDSIKSVRS